MSQLLSFMVGALIIAIFVLIAPIGPNIDNFEVFEREGMPDVARAYKGGIDSIYVEDANNNFSLTFKEYLATIPNKAARAIEEVNIKTLVGWYD